MNIQILRPFAIKNFLAKNPKATPTTRLFVSYDGMPCNDIGMLFYAANIIVIYVVIYVVMYVGSNLTLFFKSMTKGALHITTSWIRKLHETDAEAHGSGRQRKICSCTVCT